MIPAVPRQLPPQVPQQLNGVGGTTRLTITTRQVETDLKVRPCCLPGDLQQGHCAPPVSSRQLHASELCVRSRIVRVSSHELLQETGGFLALTLRNEHPGESRACRPRSRVQLQGAA